MMEKILLIGTFLSNTLSTRSVCEDLTAQLESRGWKIITTSNKVARFPRLADIVTTIWKYRGEYSVANVDVYSGAAFIWAEIAVWLLGKINKPIVLTLRGGNLPKFSTRWSNRVKKLLNSAYAVSAPSKYLKESMRYYRKDIRLIPNPLNLSSYKFQLRDNPSPQIVWLRAFHSIYNPTLAPRVLALLHKDFPNARLTMIGPDKGDGSLQMTRRKAEELGVSQWVDFPGGIPKTDVPNWLQKKDIFINTTNVDNTPVSVIEAMASGLCVVSTNVGGLPYLLDDGYDALLVPPDNPEKMADAIRKILTQPDLAARLSANARKKAETFDWSVVLPQWEELFLSLSKNA